MSLVIVFSISGAAGSAAGPLDSPTRQARELTASPRVAPVHCSARKAVRYYGSQVDEWLDKLGAVKREVSRAHARGSCPRYLAHVLQRKARALRRAYARYLEHEWHWQAWLPRLWYAIGMCETGLNWQHNSGTYQGAFGFWYGTWDSYKPRGAPSEAYLATPRQQYEAALNVQARVGLNAWGCYSHGGYRSHL